MELSSEYNVLFQQMKENKMDKLPVNHERVSATAKKVTPVLKGGKLQEEVEKQEKDIKSHKK